MEVPKKDRRSANYSVCGKQLKGVAYMGNYNTNEVWKDIENYEGYYQVSNLGRVKSLSRIMWNGKVWWQSPEKILKERWGNSGHYATVSLRKDGKSKTQTIHRLVANAFVKKVEGKKYINHIDENKANNTANNLEWVTPSENLNHRDNQKRKGAKRSTEVIGYNPKTLEMIYIPNAELKRKLGFKTDRISRSATQKHNYSHNGFYWSNYNKVD